MVEGDPLTPDTLRIEVEPDDWADLLICSTHGGKHFAHVVECKTGADLQAHQNPIPPENTDWKTSPFSCGAGYGAELKNHQGANVALRYIVLGHPDPLNLPPEHPTLLIKLAQKQWSDLECNAPGSPLTNDLFETLGLLNLQPFAMSKAKKHSIMSGLSRVGEANEVLMGVYDTLGVKPGQRKLEVYPDNDGSYMGIYIKQPPANSSPAHLQLKALSDSEDLLVWLGYFAKPDDSITRSVWLYFKSALQRDAILEKIKLHIPTARPESDSNYFWIIVDSEESVKDLPWFLSVFSATGVNLPQ